MKQDYYTKAILTVIAICLLVLTLKQVNIISTAKANNVVSTKNYGLVPLNKDGSINARINGEVDVNISSCSSNAFYYAEPIEVKIH